jgi:uncharacterized damage-inducible protein DinB
MRRHPIALASCVLVAAATRPATAAAQARVGVEAVQSAWQGVTTNIARAAEQMKESDFAYRPTESVRTFGQLVGHVAGAQKMICAAALGEKPTAEDEIEKTATTKAALIDALKATTAYCERAYAQTDAAAGASTTLFGQTQTRMYALATNAAHNSEHYGNIVTYMRMKGMVPPSSQPAAR